MTEEQNLNHDMMNQNIPFGITKTSFLRLENSQNTFRSNPNRFMCEDIVALHRRLLIALATRKH